MGGAGRAAAGIGATTSEGGAAGSPARDDCEPRAGTLASAGGGTGSSSTGGRSGAPGKAGRGSSGTTTRDGLGGAGDGAEPSELAGESSAAGRAGEGGYSEPAPLLPNGTRLCVDGNDCLGLSCAERSGEFWGLCTRPCSDVKECGSEETCIEGWAGEAVCVARCATPLDCEYGFDCYDTTAAGDYVCLPTAWVR